MSPSDQLEGRPAGSRNEGKEKPMTINATFDVKVDVAKIVLATAVLLQTLA
ncbi:hypothetical protein [Bradyrhizobium stylosanthis]|uniref:hypothetical protein n=1 Tax=Bradyrhizobium stylosanthis TaxID=1803665 RepID=UPI001644182F|nr:hypothetical protein [Bradyrhizobium stylosanthis]